MISTCEDFWDVWAKRLTKGENAQKERDKDKFKKLYICVCVYVCERMCVFMHVCVV